MPHTNKLINETSPYLQQHAHNPVDWFPWCEQALEKARQENKPILLSIGYAACHWCHVMAHESFEDNETAALMNKLFINIKVDKEERPDLDKIYQTTHYLLSRQSGGWPLTVFLAPHDLTPFFSGTYFPHEDNYQLPAFKKVLEHIAETYQNHQTEISLQNQELQKILNPLPPVISDVRLNSQPIQHAEQVLQRSYDAVNGGFGTAPKFPQPARLQFLFSSDSVIPFKTLLHMAKGGICDQVGGGFFRYSVDAGWQIPHFEKMLYDNAQLLFLLSTAFKKYSDVVFADTAHAVSNWVMQTMQSAEGGYYASLDADSEGQEGKYYVWDKKEVASLLTQEEFSFIEKYYGLDQPPNFENHWHLTANPNLPADQNILEAANKKLLKAREKRTPPSRDTKILTSWNALMIKAMMTAGTLLNQTQYIQSAQQALSYIKNHHWINHQLLSTKNYNAYLDDYAFLLDSILLSLQISWDTNDLTFAMELCEILLKDFYDTKAGGFYFTPHDHEKLLYRPKSMMDEVTPSGNAVAARCLFLAGHLLGETRYIDAATKTLHAAWPMLTQYPAEHCALLQVLQDYLKPPAIIIIRGKHDEIKKWQAAYQTLDNAVFAIPADEKNLPGLLNLKKPKEKTCAYICEGMQCREVTGYPS